MAGPAIQHLPIVRETGETTLALVQPRSSKAQSKGAHQAKLVSDLKVSRAPDDSSCEARPVLNDAPFRLRPFLQTHVQALAFAFRVTRALQPALCSADRRDLTSPAQTSAINRKHRASPAQPASGCTSRAAVLPNKPYCPLRLDSDFNRGTPDPSSSEPTSTSVSPSI